MKSRLKIYINVIISVFLTVILTLPVSALTDSQWSMYNTNRIYYYNPEGGTNLCYIGDIPVQGSNTAEKIWTGLTSFLTDEQAAGIMGNMISESAGTFNPVIHEISWRPKFSQYDIETDASISYGIGLIQWSFGRRVDILAYIKSKNSSLMQYFLDPEQYGKQTISGDQLAQMIGESDFNQLIQLELEFLKTELDTKFSGFYNQTTVFDATKYFLETVERPQDPYISAHMNRVSQAEGYYGLYHGFTPDGGSGGSSNGCTVSGNFQQLVLNYAWPQYHKAPYTDRKEDYATIVAKRSQEGKYVGGAVNGILGIDCGGFVTTLMQESGFAPDYNDSKGATLVQEQWVINHGWTLLNGSTTTPIDTGNLQPGDVAFTTGHTFVYVGNIPGFESNIASASIGNGSGRTSGENKDSSRAPMAGTEALVINGDGEIVRWYRKN